MLIVLVACAAFVMLGDEVDAAGYDLALELNDTSSVKVAQGINPIGFNLTLTNNGTAASDLFTINVTSIPQNWTNLLLWTSLTMIPPGPAGPPCEVWMDKGETIEVHLVVTPPNNQLNDTYWFTLIAYPRADPAYNVTYDVGIVNPQVAGFHLEPYNPPENNTYQAIPPSVVVIRFALFNTGNGADHFLVQGSSSRADVGWILEIVNGVDEYGYTQEVPPDPLMENPYYIDVRVPMPAWTEVNVEGIISLNATSVFNVSYQRPPAVATVRALQYFNFQVYINGPDNKEGIPGETVTFEIKIHNPGNGPDTFSLKAKFDEALNPGFVAYANPSNITIERNDNGTALFMVEVPENPPKKTYFFTVQVWSKSHELSPVTKSFAVEVGQYFRIELTSEDPWRVTDPGGNLEFEVTVRNTGNGLDSIVIESLEGVPQYWLTYTQPPEVTLLQNQTAVIKIIVIIPSKFEEAPLMGYTLTVIAKSSRSDAEATVDLLIDIRQFWRIEWMSRGGEITNPERPTAQAGSIRPRPEINLFNGTTTTVVMGVRNFGNGPDEVTVEVENGFPQVEIAITPTRFNLESAATQDIIVTITVPKSHKPGVYYFLLKASSSDGSVQVRSVPMDFLLMPVFTENDFSDLEYNDSVDDNYLFTFTSDEAGGEVLESYGRHHRPSNIDIVSIMAVHDHTAGMVTVTLRFAAEVVDEVGTEYWIFFVNGSHRQPEALRNPWEHTNGSFLWTFSDQARTVCNMYYENGQGGSTYDLPGLEVIVEGNTITFRVPSRELRSAGVAPVSGFGVYAYAHTLTIREDGAYRVRVNWDAAGVGAAGVPAEFSNEPEEGSPLPPFLAPMAIALVAVALLALAGRRRR